MIKLWQKTFILIGLLGFLSLLPTAPASAQKMENHREAMDAIDYAERFGGDEGKKYADILRDNASGGNQIICGNRENLCDKTSQICLRCKESFIATGILGIDEFSGVETDREVEDEGRCVSKDYINNIQAAWPDCVNYYKDRSQLFGAGKAKKERSLTLERYGFLSEGMNKQLGITFSEDEHVFKDKNGHSYMMLTSANYSVAYGNSDDKGKAFKGCEVFPVKAYNMQGCFYCPIANIVFNAADNVTENAFSYFANSFKVLLAIIFGIWLALMSANYAFAMTKQDAPKFLTSVLGMSFKVAIAFYLLSYSTDIFRFFVRPLLEAGLAMGENIQTLPIKAEKIEGYLKSTRPGYYGETLRTKIENYLTFIQSQLAYMQALGTTIFCVGSHRLASWDTLKALLPGGESPWDRVLDALRVMFLGGFFTIVGFLITIAFGYFFIDSVVQLIIIGAMIAFMIVTWPLPFGQTKYASKGLEMLLNTFFTFFMTGFVVCVCISLIDNSLATAQEIQQGSEKATAAGFQAIIDALYDQNWETLNTSTTLGVSGFLLLIFSAIFGFKFIGKAPEVSGSLSSGLFQGRGGLAGRVGTMAYSATKGVAGKLASPFADGLADQYHAAGGVIGMAGGAVSGISKIPGGLGSMASKAGEKLAEHGHGHTAKVFGAAGKTLSAVGKSVDKTVGATGRFVRKGAKKLHSTYRH